MSFIKGDKVIHIESNQQYEVTHVKPLYQPAGNNSQYVLTLEDCYGRMVSCLDENVARVIEDEDTNCVVIDYGNRSYRRL